MLASGRRVVDIRLSYVVLAYVGRLDVRRNPPPGGPERFHQNTFSRMCFH